MKFLAVSPHPDDIDFGCAGTIARLRRQGHGVEELIISDGSKGNNNTGREMRKLAHIRKQEQKAAAKVLGVTRVHFLGERDGEVENTRALRRKLVKIIRKLKPDVVMSFDPAAVQSFEFPSRSHLDHRQTAEAVFDAVYPAAGSAAFFPELVKQGFAPHEIKELWFFAADRPNKWVDIAGTIEKKIQALLCHKSQIGSQAELKGIVRERARALGRKRRMRYAEAFRVVRVA